MRVRSSGADRGPARDLAIHDDVDARGNGGTGLVGAVNVQLDQLLPALGGLDIVHGQAAGHEVCPSSQSRKMSVSAALPATRSGAAG
jgi:hypothetical protein